MDCGLGAECVRLASWNSFHIIRGNDQTLDTYCWKRGRLNELLNRVFCHNNISHFPYFTYDF